MNLDLKSLRDCWSAVASMFASAIRIPLAFVAVFMAVCISILGAYFVFRLTMWIYVSFLAKPWN